MTSSTATRSVRAEQQQLVRVGPLDGMASPTVVSGGRHGIAVFLSDGQPFAVDNRCPHMGFPLHKGSVRDGILTCHWHHARFDLSSGGTFDPFADDVRVYPTVVDDGIVYVDVSPRAEDWQGRWKSRLRDGIEQDLNLLMVKAVLALHDGGVDASEIVEVGGRFGARYREAGYWRGETLGAMLARKAAEGPDRLAVVFRERHQFSPGSTIHLQPDLAHAHVFDADSGRALAA